VFDIYDSLIADVVLMADGFKPLIIFGLALWVAGWATSFGVSFVRRSAVPRLALWLGFSKDDSAPSVARTRKSRSDNEGG
jgi:hypothetical protein